MNHRKIGSSFKRKINLLTNHNQFSRMIYPFMMKFYTGENYFTKYFLQCLQNPDVKLNYRRWFGYLFEEVYFQQVKRSKSFKILNKIASSKIDDYFVYCPELLFMM